MLRKQLSTGFQLALFWSITPSFSSVVPPFNSTRDADNVWFASRLDLRLLKCVRLTALQPFGRRHFVEHIP